MTIELRQWAIEQAIKGQSKDVLKDAKSYLKWVTMEGIGCGEVSESLEERGYVEKEWAAKALTEAKKRVMQNIISRFNRDLPVNGQRIADDLKMTQSNASIHLADLVREGYVGRKGNKFWPIRTITGKMLPVVIHKMPKGVAKGYTGQMKSPLGEVATIKQM